MAVQQRLKHFIVRYLFFHVNHCLRSLYTICNEGTMALYIDQRRYPFRFVPDSTNLYCVTTLVFYKPWLSLKLLFGNQICFRGYIYFFDTYRDIQTEFGILRIQVLLSTQYPFVTHHFILKPSVCIDKCSVFQHVTRKHHQRIDRSHD